MKTTPIKQISNRSQTYPKIHLNNSVVVSLCFFCFCFYVLKCTQKKVSVAELIDFICGFLKKIKRSIMSIFSREKAINQEFELTTAITKP